MCTENSNQKLKWYIWIRESEVETEGCFLLGVWCVAW